MSTFWYFQMNLLKNLVPVSVLTPIDRLLMYVKQDTKVSVTFLHLHKEPEQRKLTYAHDNGTYQNTNQSNPYSRSGCFQHFTM